MAKEKKNELRVDDVIKDIQLHIKDTWKIEVPEGKVRGLAFATLKKSGQLSKEDKYKNYDHVARVLKLFNDNFNNIFEWEDIEHFTGNLFYAMRLGTRRPIDSVEAFVKVYKKQYTEKDRLVIDTKQFDTDMALLIEDIKSSMSVTWKYLEKQQETGVGMIINKVLKYLLEQKQNEKPKKL